MSRLQARLYDDNAGRSAGVRVRERGGRGQSADLMRRKAARRTAHTATMEVRTICKAVEQQFTTGAAALWRVAKQPLPEHRGHGDQIAGPIRRAGLSLSGAVCAIENQGQSGKGQEVSGSCKCVKRWQKGLSNSSNLPKTGLPPCLSWKAPDTALS